MKRASILGALAIVAGFLFAAPAAHAVEGYVTPKFDVGHGVMCEARIGGTLWPVNGSAWNTALFYYCGTSTAANRGSAVYNSAKGISSLEANVGINLGNVAHVRVYVFDSPLQYATASGNDPQTTWTSQLTNPAFSTFISDGAPANGIIVYENVADGAAGYPALKPNPQNLQAHDTKHEAGHHFDRNWLGTGAWLSNQSAYANVYSDDLAYELANNPNHAADVSAFNYWWGTRKELFAEEFAIVFGSSARPVDQKTTDYFICTKHFVFKYGRDQVAPTSWPLPHCTP